MTTDEFGVLGGGVTPQQFSQGHIEVVIIVKMKCQFHWWRKPEETTGL